MSTPSTTESELIKIRQCQGLCFVVIVYIQGMKFCPCYDFCWKSFFLLFEKFLKYTTQNFLPTKIFWRYVHFALKLPQGGKDFGNIFGAGQK